MFTRLHSLTVVVYAGIAGVLLLIACARPAAPTPPTATPQVAATRLSEPLTPGTTVLANEPASSPVEFVLQIRGDPHPLKYPIGLALDAQGHLYVVDSGNNRLQIFDSSGQFLTTWGSEGSDDGQFHFFDDLGKGGVAVDGQGNVYIADGYNARIQKFSSAGQFLTKWGSRGDGDGQFYRLLSVAVDQQGNVYAIDDFRNDIQKFTSEGKFVTKWGGSGNGEGQLAYPGYIAVDGQGNVYVADFGNHRVQKFDSTGKFLTQWGSLGTDEGQFDGPVGIEVDGQGNVYVSEEHGNRVQKFDSNGKFLTMWGSGGSGEGQFSTPYDLAVDRLGNIYVADVFNHRVQKFRQK